MQWLALDIGGANVKLADGSGFAMWQPFALWQEPKRLTQHLRTLIAQSPPHDHLAVTMTGELADCFLTKTAGVQFILEAVTAAADGRHTRVYLTSGQMVSPQVAGRRPLEVAAANWHALGRFCTRLAPSGLAMLIDVGSTTTDIVPLWEGELAPAGTTDTERLQSRELVYCGVARTPICGLTDQLPYRDIETPIARELFATTRDAYLILGDLPEDSVSRQTADGGPATKAAARTRLGRLLSADAEQFNHRDAVVMAHRIADVQTSLLSDSLRHVAGRWEAAPTTLVISGEGEFLTRRAIAEAGFTVEPISISRKFGESVSRCAPAHALAVLAREAAEK